MDSICCIGHEFVDMHTKKLGNIRVNVDREWLAIHLRAPRDVTKGTENDEEEEEDYGDYTKSLPAELNRMTTWT